MPWPTWEQSGVAAVLSGLLYLVLRRYRRQSTLAGPAALEFALISALYAAWRLARQIPLGSDDLAIERAHRLVSFQQVLHLPTELSLQRFVLDHDWLGAAVDGVLRRDARASAARLPGVVVRPTP